jgi:hypothetical protein
LLNTDGTEKNMRTEFLSKKPRRRLENVLKYILQNKETEGTDWFQLARIRRSQCL